MDYFRGANSICSGGDRAHLRIADGENNRAGCGGNERQPHPHPGGVAGFDHV